MVPTLIVVRRDYRELWMVLYREFADHPAIQVILDRRQGERRCQQLPVSTDRRRQDRRRPASTEDDARVCPYLLTTAQSSGPDELAGAGGPERVRSIPAASQC